MTLGNIIGGTVLTVLIVTFVIAVGSCSPETSPSEIFAPPGSYVDIGGEYIPVPNDWTPGDPIPDRDP